MAGIFNRSREPKRDDVRQALAGETIVASAAETEKVEGNHYFALDTVNWEFLQKSPRISVCHWKGLATYYDVVVDDNVYPAAAWSYQEPSEAAANIRGHVAFWRGVKVA